MRDLLADAIVSTSPRFARKNPSQFEDRSSSRYRTVCVGDHAIGSVYRTSLSVNRAVEHVQIADLVNRRVCVVVAPCHGVSDGPTADLVSL